MRHPQLSPKGLRVLAKHLPHPPMGRHPLSVGWGAPARRERRGSSPRGGLRMSPCDAPHGRQPRDTRHRRRRR
eukprot:4105328-Alexandrium_andersonii.AAC.1